jgi:hypothetical protein
MSTTVVAIQHHLERLYELDPGYRAEQFLVSDREQLPSMHAALAHAPEEQLLLAEQDGDLLLTLYLSAQLLERLEADCPLDRLHGGNLADLCLAVEGVSHFLYVVWNARFERPVTQLELELQAEIDKYVVSALLLDHQGRGSLPGDLHAHLFRRVRYAEPMAHAQRCRYHRANSYAASYCDYLARTYPRAGGSQHQLRELRRFYRLLHLQKLRHIEHRGH